MLGVVATCDHLQSDMMTLRIFGSQSQVESGEIFVNKIISQTLDDSVVDRMQSKQSDICEVVTLDYLQDCVNSFESTDSGVYTSSRSAETSYSNLHLLHLSESHKTTQLNDIGMNFIRIEYVSLDDTSQPENSVANRTNREKTIKPIDVPELLHSPKSASLEIMQISKPFFNSVYIDSKCMNEKNESKDYKYGNIACNKSSEQKLFILNNNYDTPNLGTIRLSELRPNLYLHNNKADSSDTNSIIFIKDKETKTDMIIKACEQCDMTFKYKRHLDRHLEGHQKNNCPHCNEKFARRKHLEVHLFRVHGERSTKHPYVCDICSRGFPKNTLLEWHRVKHIVETTNCSDCGTIMEPESHANGSTDKQRKKRNWKCTKCLETSTTEETTSNNGQIRDNHKCMKCEITFASKKKANEHLKTIHSSPEDSVGNTNGVYFCTDCRHKFQKKDDYTRHIQSASHLNKASKEVLVRGIFTCSICSKELITQRALDQHIRRIHKGKKQFSCDIYGCLFQCARRTDLDRHKHLHVEERNVICEHCGKTFTSVSILNDHVLYVHNKERQFICEECGKAFKRNSLLNRHKLSHQQLRPFACMQCNTAFKRSHHLTRHMESCHRITLEKKKKVVKLMKTEGGHLVPVPEKPKKMRYKKIKIKGVHSSTKLIGKCSATRLTTTIATANASPDPQDQMLPNSANFSENPSLSAEPLNLLSTTQNNAPQILSLVDISSGQVLTVEVADQETLAVNNLIDPLDANCNETLDLPNYQDLEFQNTVLSVDQNYDDQTNYLELPLENVDEPLLSDTYGGKIDSLSTIESYFTQPFLSLLNL